MITASVIIPVRNNARGLKLCLDALAKQTYPQEHFEVIVVDNASTEPLDSLKNEYPNVKWLYDSGSGSYSARNRGLQDAVGDILAFTDSDCIPDERWLEEGIATLHGSDAAIVGGNIVLQNPVDRELNVYELIELVTSAVPDNNRRLVAERGFTATGNMFAYRRVFSRWGNFDAKLKSAGDREWVTRARNGGEKLIYAERAIILHPRRSAFKPMILKFRRHVGGRIELLKRSPMTVRAALRELLDLSPFDPRIYVIPFRLPMISSSKMRLKFLAMALVVSVVVTAEKLRVFLGGQSSRG